MHNLPFCEKTYNCENFRRKSLLLTMGHFFFSKFKIKPWNGIITKNEYSFFKLASVKSVKTTLFFFIISNAIVKIFFQESYLIAKVERKEFS